MISNVRFEWGTEYAHNERSTTVRVQWDQDDLPRECVMRGALVVDDDARTWIENAFKTALGLQPEPVA